MENKPLGHQKSQVIAKLKSKGKKFEILVDFNKAMDFKKSGKGFIQDILIFDVIFSDYKKGLKFKNSDLEEVFGTSDVYKVAQEIIKKGEIAVPIEVKKEERKNKMKQLVDYLARICVDPKTMKPHPPERIKSAIEQLAFHPKDNEDLDSQARSALKLIQKILPIKLETKKIELKIPAAFAARSYGLLKDSLIKEEWLSDGSFLCVIEKPAASLMDFFDKLNAITHGSALTKEI